MQRRPLNEMQDIPIPLMTSFIFDTDGFYWTEINYFPDMCARKNHENNWNILPKVHPS